MNREKIIAKMKERVFNANLQLPEWGLVQLTWGNASEVNRDLGVIVIKPSGVDYKQMTPDQMVVTDLDGKPLEADAHPLTCQPMWCFIRPFLALMPWSTPTVSMRFVGLKLDVICLAMGPHMPIPSMGQCP